MTDIDLKPFCYNEDDGRANIQKPFSRGDWTYASDGHILVRVPRRADVPEVEKAPHAEKLFPDPLPAVLPLERFELMEPDPEALCLDCAGRGTEHECDHCQCVCVACRGSGMEDPDHNVSVELAGAVVGARLIRLLQRLPNVQRAATMPARFEHGPMYFVFDGGDGLISMRKAEADRHLQPVPEPRA